MLLIIFDSCNHCMEFTTASLDPNRLHSQLQTSLRYLEKYDTQLPPSCLLYIIYAHTQDNYVWNLFIPAPLGLLENYVSQLKEVFPLFHTLSLLCSWDHAWCPWCPHFRGCPQWRGSTLWNSTAHSFAHSQLSELSYLIVHTLNGRFTSWQIERNQSELRLTHANDWM